MSVTFTLENIISEGITVAGKGNINIPIADIQIGKAIVRDADVLMQKLDIGTRIMIVSDANTHKVLGKKLNYILKGNITVTEYIYPTDVNADMTKVEQLLNRVDGLDCLVAVGSGTINDICKMASYRANIPYIVWGTAPSMNGYCSATASLSIHGFKSSLPAHLPKAVYMDTDIMAKAPFRLIQSGVGDMLCRITAQADWLLSHRLLTTEYVAEPFLLLLSKEQQLLTSIQALISRDYGAIECLTEMLLLSGVGMYIAGGSYPASQAEHMIAHTYGMINDNTKGKQVIYKPFHGEEIAVTTMTMLKKQNNILEADTVKWNQQLDQAVLEQLFVASICKEMHAIYRWKKEQFSKINTFNWPAICSQIKQIHVLNQKVMSCLKEMKLPLTCRDLGWDALRYEQAVALAQYSRRRFTFLDLEIA